MITKILNSNWCLCLVGTILLFLWKIAPKIGKIQEAHVFGWGEALLLSWAGFCILCTMLSFSDFLKSFFRNRRNRHVPRKPH